MATIAGPRETLALSYRNLSSATSLQTTEARRLLEAELRRAGLRIGKGLETTVTISENAREYVWVAQISKDGAVQAAVVPVERLERVVSERISGFLQSELVWQQGAQMLDLLMVDDDRFLVLDVSRIALFRGRASTEPDQSAPLTLAAALPRDPRGLLERTSEGFRAWLPNTLCTGSLDPLVLECGPNSRPWPTPAGPGSLAAGRNYFSGEQPFYSAATIAGTTVVAGTDRRTYAGERSFTGWGSDLAGLDSDCGQKLLATRAVVDEPDAVQGFEIAQSGPLPVTRTVHLPGPVTALWSRGRVATAIVRSLATARYEAYRISLACGS